MSHSTLPRYLVALFCLTAFSLPVARADLTLTSPPRETREDGERIYGPIAQLLSKELGEKVIYVRAVNWIDYSNDMKKGAYDIIFDGPHFAAWRVKHLDNAPLVKLPGALTFVVIAHANDPGTNSLRDLRTGAICSLAAPNLGAMAILAQFDNPIYQPSTVEALEPMGVMKAFKANKCRAAIMMDKLLKKLSDDDKKLIKVIYTSRSYPDQTITVSKRVKEEQRKALVTALTANGGVPAAKALLGLYTKQATHFEVAQLDEYAGLEDLLEGVIWGW